MSEDDIVRILRHPLAMVASDSSVLKFGEGVPHPRGYRNNARVLGVYGPGKKSPSQLPFGDVPERPAEHLHSSQSSL